MVYTWPTLKKWIKNYTFAHWLVGITTLSMQTNKMADCTLCCQVDKF